VKLHIKLLPEPKLYDKVVGLGGGDNISEKLLKGKEVLRVHVLSSGITHINYLGLHLGLASFFLCLLF
jgi:hypothetical protein